MSNEKKESNDKGAAVLTITVAELKEILSTAVQAGAREAALAVVAAEASKRAAAEVENANRSGLRGTGTGRQCPECKQPEHIRYGRFRFACCPDEKVLDEATGYWKLTGRGTCKNCQEGKDCCGMHVRKVVWPRDAEYSGAFAGIQLNGIWYDSKGPGRRIVVPAVSDMDAQIVMFERNERDTRLGRPIQRMYPHNRMSIQGG